MNAVPHEQMVNLKYKFKHVLIVFMQCIESGRMFYSPRMIVNSFAKFKTHDGMFIPCFKHANKMPNGIEVVDYSYATMKKPLGYGTYNIVPREVHESDVGKFF